MTDQLHRLVDVATGQHGAIAPHQAELVGVTHRELRRRVQSGVLHKSGVHVVRSPFIEATPLADLAAVVLDCGSGAVASGRTAAALARTRRLCADAAVPCDDPPRPLDRAVGSSHPHDVRAAGDRPHAVHGIATMTVERDLIDLARSIRREPLTAALDGAIRDQLTTEPRLHGRIAALRSSGRYGIPALLAVIEGNEITRGAHSWLERRFLELCADRGLPRPQPQVVLTSAKDRFVRVDFSFARRPSSSKCSATGITAHRLSSPVTQNGSMPS